MPARLLTAPTLQYKNETARIRDGQWNPMKFIHSKDAQTWLVCYFHSGRCGQRDHGEITHFTENLCRQAARKGYKYEADHFLPLFSQNCYIIRPLKTTHPIEFLDISN